MENDIAIKVEHISKTFHEAASAKSLKEGFVNIGRKITGKKERGIHKGDFTALKDINFEVKKGDFVGVVGRNGCGKSTLLKILAGVYTPTSGAVAINGKLTPFIELGVGFNPELSGRDNVFLNGALLGFTRKQMEEMYDDIVSFAELEQFMDMKLKHYSSGMQVRLAFSVAIRADTDILLLDEVLAVGDEAFQRKCFDYFATLKRKKKTVVLVTHSMDSVRRYCTKALLISDGTVKYIGSPEKVAYEYSVLNSEDDPVETSTKEDTEWGTKEIVIKKLYLKGNKQKNITKTGDSFAFMTDFLSGVDHVVKINFSLTVTFDGLKCFDISTYYSSPLIISPFEAGSIEVAFSDFRLLPGSYSCNISLFDEKMEKVYHGVRDAFTINVLGTAKENSATGIVKTTSIIRKV